jgi:hypothetical protein
MPASEVCAEIWFGDPAAIAFATLGLRVLVARLLPLGLSLLVPIFLPFLLLSHVLRLFRLLHLALVLLTVRMPVSTLRLLILPVFLWLFVRPRLLLRPSLFLPILRMRTILLLIAMLILRRGYCRRAEQQRSTNPAHD